MRSRARAPTPKVTISATAGSISSPFALAFDSVGDLWLANYSSDTLVEFTPSQLAATGSPTPNVTVSATGGSIDGPLGLAFDSSGDLWVANGSGEDLVEFTPGQLAATGSPTPNVTVTHSLSDPVGLAFDSSGDLWAANNAIGTLVEFTPSQLAATGSPTPAVTIEGMDTDLVGPTGLAFDSSGDLWVSNNAAGSVLVFSSAQLASATGPTDIVPATTIAGTNTGLHSPVGLAPQTAGSVPGGVSATVGDAQAAVSWGAVAGATSYEVFDATSPGAEDYLGTPGCMATTTGCTVASLSNGTPYYFTVEAVGPYTPVPLSPGGPSAPSTEVSATPEAPPPSTTTTTTTVPLTTTSTTVPTTTTTVTVTSTTTTIGAIPGASYTSLRTTTGLESSANPSVVGDQVTYTATVTPVPNGGAVSFADNGATASDCGAVAVSTSSGQATCSVTYTSPGSHTITVGYSGDATYAASASGLLTQVVNEAASFPEANASYPNGGIVRFAGTEYVFAGGRAFGLTAATLAQLQKVDHAKVLQAPSGTAAPTGATLRAGTLLSTKAINGNPTIYVVGTSGDLYRFASPGQFFGGGFDPALVVTAPSLGALAMATDSAGAAGITAFSTSADGAIVNSGGTYYVFAGGKAFGIPTQAVLLGVERADPATALFGNVTPPQAASPLAGGVLLSIAGADGVFVTYKGDAVQVQDHGAALR